MILKRIYRDEQRTYGVLIDDIPFAVTLELPWKQNQQDISCIPAGQYSCIKWHSPSKGWCYSIKNVPNRTDVLIHKGNTTADTQGCILVGESYDKLYNKTGWLWGILNSRHAMNELLKRGGNFFVLHIVDFCE